MWARARSLSVRRGHAHAEGVWQADGRYWRVRAHWWPAQGPRQRPARGALASACWVASDCATPCWSPSPLTPCVAGLLLKAARPPAIIASHRGLLTHLTAECQTIASGSSWVTLRRV